jgi:hypothetical protein
MTMVQQRIHFTADEKVLGRFKLKSFLDGFSRNIVHWEIREAMTQRQIEIILQRAKERFPDAVTIPATGEMEAGDAGKLPARDNSLGFRRCVEPVAANENRDSSQTIPEISPIPDKIHPFFTLEVCGLQKKDGCPIHGEP